jgi:hypothetical protein
VAGSRHKTVELGREAALVAPTAPAAPVAPVARWTVAQDGCGGAAALGYE